MSEEETDYNKMTYPVLSDLCSNKKDEAACYTLGLAYYNGNGGQYSRLQSFIQAKDYFKRAALYNDNYPLPKYALGIMNEKGYDGEDNKKNIDEAIKYYELAAKDGYENAFHALVRLAKDNSNANAALKRLGVSLQGGGYKKIKSNRIRARTRKHKHKWSLKYKRSIDCKHPKGFSQRQHCKYGRKTMRKLSRKK
jgi:TPR repeat protein